MFVQLLETSHGALQHIFRFMWADLRSNRPGILSDIQNPFENIGASIMYKGKVFLLNPDNAEVLDGTRRNPNRTGKMPGWAKWMLIIGGAAYLAMSAFFFVWMVTALNDWMMLNQRGVTTEGRLVGRDSNRINSSASGGVSTGFIRYWLYSYTTEDGQTFEGQVQVNQEAYDSYVYNMPIQVLYLQNNPGVSRLMEENTLEFERVPVFLGGANTLMIVMIAFINWGEFRRARRYQREGRVIDGRVVKPILQVGESKEKRIATLYLNYQIVSPVSGREIVHMNQYRRDDLTESNLPLVGGRVAVFYVDDRLFTVL